MPFGQLLAVAPPANVFDEQAKTIGLAKGAIIPGTTMGKENPTSPPTLDKAGIDKNLAKAARATARSQKPNSSAAATAGVALVTGSTSRLPF